MPLALPQELQIAIEYPFAILSSALKEYKALMA